MSRPLRALAVACVLALAFPVTRPAQAQRYVPGEFKEFPRVKFADSLESVNDRCIVSGQKLNPEIRPVYVNWRPIGFC